MTHSRFRAATRLVAFLLVIAGLVPFYLAVFPLGKRARRFFALPFYRACLALTGLVCRTTGLPANGGGTLFVANHASYLDVPVLATLVDGRFVAKSEVRGWPLLGFLARIAGTLFVARKASKIPQQRLLIAKHLACGESIFLFPEGSSSDGSGVLPFRPGLLSSALVSEAPLPVQPVSIVYGPTLTQGERDQFAWYGEMELVPHLWRLFGLRERTVVAVHFHPARLSSEFQNPRDLARWTERTVVLGIQADLKHATKAADALPPANETSPTYAI